MQQPAPRPFTSPSFLSSISPSLSRFLSLLNCQNWGQERKSSSRTARSYTEHSTSLWIDPSSAWPRALNLTSLLQHMGGSRTFTRVYRRQALPEDKSTLYRAIMTTVTTCRTSSTMTVGVACIVHTRLSYPGSETNTIPPSPYSPTRRSRRCWSAWATSRTTSLARSSGSERWRRLSSSTSTWGSHPRSSTCPQDMTFRTRGESLLSTSTPMAPPSPSEEAFLPLLS
mmetsp:Transcript_44423/g.140184  ORF Transcript_44423/g.140184 Transcript_44423/m.140184 type:complete len:227 (+) Transcript_44423:273-953(+)